MYSPVLVGLAVGASVAALAAWASGAWRRRAAEADAGIESLCAMRWRDYAHLVEDMLRERGFVRSDEQAGPGEGGYELTMLRGRSRYLVSCKNGASHRVGDTAVRELASLVQLQGAEGAVLATTGHVDASALRLAGQQGIELLAGNELWRQLERFVPHELRQEAQARAAHSVLRRSVGSLAAGTVAALVLMLVLPDRRAADGDARVAPAAAAPSRATAADTAPLAPPRDGLPAAMPDDSLTEAELAARRASAALEIRGNPVVENAVWATRSTLVVTLIRTGAEIPDSLFEESCRILVQYEEMRYSRLQIESAASDPGAPATVRWRQCR